MANLKITGDLEVVGKIKKDDVKVSLPSESGTLATEEYVEENGGKIASISVNGVQQTIDKDKNVEITIDTKTPVYDGLDSESTTDALSANQGKILNDKLAEKLDIVAEPHPRYQIYGTKYNSTETAMLSAYPGSKTKNWLAMYKSSGRIETNEPKEDLDAANKLYVDTVVASKSGFEFVDALPTEDIKSTTIYLLKNQESESLQFSAYVYQDETWGLLGGEKVDLNNYYTKEEVDDKISAGGSGSGAIDFVWEVWS